MINELSFVRLFVTHVLRALSLDVLEVRWHDQNGSWSDVVLDVPATIWCPKGISGAIDRAEVCLDEVVREMTKNKGSPCLAEILFCILKTNSIHPTVVLGALPQRDTCVSVQNPPKAGAITWGARGTLEEVLARRNMGTRRNRMVHV